MNTPNDSSHLELQRRLNLRTALVFLFMSLSLITAGSILKDARDELLMFADIENEQYQGSEDQDHRDNAMVLLMTAGSYRNVIVGLWGLGGIGLVVTVLFLALAYREKK